MLSSDSTLAFSRKNLLLGRIPRRGGRYIVTKGSCAGKERSVPFMEVRTTPFSGDRGFFRMWPGHNYFSYIQGPATVC